ncbi:MAG: transaldolase [Planctomycetaceae bacterium]|nr:transaldolase [Planctomycetaceae bacterium]
MADRNAIASQVKALVREGFDHEFGKPRVPQQADAEWAKVRAAGTTLWLDTGDMDEATGLWTSEFEALTTNNTLLNNEVQKGLYDGLVGKAAATIRQAAPGIDPQELLLEVAFVLNAYHGLRLVEQFDAHVSVELHTDLAGDVERTVAYGKRYYDICPERFYVKVPLTPAGYLGARKLAANGVPINFTLGFSARHNYVAALLSQPDYVNVFLGRLNAFVSDNQLGDGKNVGEKATLATQRALLELRAAGRSRSRLIGASMREGAQVATLAGLDVFTMPPKVAAEYRKHPVAEIRSEVDTDPAVTCARDVQLDDFNGATLWEVPEPFRKCVDALLQEDLDHFSPDDLQAYFEQAGFGDFLPRWSATDLQTITADGKIPPYQRWKDQLSAGSLGLDALMNISGLCSFATDQQAFDDRVRSLL